MPFPAPGSIQLQSSAYWNAGNIWPGALSMSLPTCPPLSLPGTLETASTHRDEQMDDASFTQTLEDAGSDEVLATLLIHTLVFLKPTAIF